MGTTRAIIEIDPPAQDLRVLGQRERSRARGTDSTSPVLTRQGQSISSGLQGATTRTSGSSSMGGTEMPTNEASAESAATGAISDREDAGDRTSTGDGTVVHERSEGPSADAVLERAANTVTTSTGAHSSSNDPSEAPVGGGASAESMTSSGTDPAGESSTPTTREGTVLSRTSVGRWGAGLRAARTTTSPTQSVPAPVEVPPATTEAIDSGPRMVQRSGGRGPRPERAVEEARRLPGIPFEEVPPADMDAAVNGPLYDSHVIRTIEAPTAMESNERRRVLAQASRRVKRQEEDQLLINDL
jgi:hypothetical protein